MTAMSMSSSGGGSKALGILFLLVVGFTLFALATGGAISHAIERHGADAVSVKNCLNQNGPAQVWYQPTNQRWANICQVGDLFGMQITNGIGDEITAFIKNKMRRLDQVEQYLTNRGYVRVR